jgi:methionyl-tRNA formyltransferase
VKELALEAQIPIWQPKRLKKNAKTLTWLQESQFVVRSSS